MVRRLGMMIAVTAVVLGALPAHAFTMGEVTATTGVHGTLAKSGTTNAAGTIGTVKNALGKAVATKEGQLAGAGVQVGWGGRPGGSGWVTASSAGWTAASGTGWATASANGWARGGGASAWARGAWNTTR